MPDLHRPGFLWFNAMDHTGKTVTRIHLSPRHPAHRESSSGDSRAAMAWSIPGLRQPGFTRAHAMVHAGNSAARIPRHPWHEPPQKAGTGDSHASMAWSIPGTQQRRFPSPDGIAHTGIPAVAISTPGWRGACPPRQLRQWRWCRLWMWSARPVSSWPVPAAWLWPLPHWSGGSPWLCGSG